MSPVQAIQFPPRPSRRRRTDPAAFAAAQRVLFAGMNLHVGRSRIAHQVAWLDWIDGLVLPAPACRQGFAGHGFHAELQPTHWPVTCRRCRRLAGETIAADDEPTEPLALF